MTLPRVQVSNESPHNTSPTGTCFTPNTYLEVGQGIGRTGTLHTAHGDIQTPAFIPVGTKATVKSLTPLAVKELGAQAVLANAYHLYIQPGADLVDEAGGLANFMNWDGPTFTDSGGFQILSMGSGFKKVLSHQFVGTANADTDVAQDRSRRAHVDDDGVWFKSHLNGSMHRFTSEVSMEIQHQLGADIIFAFDELTTLLNSYEYQVESLERTRRWAERSLRAHAHITQERVNSPRQILFGVIQGAKYQELRKKAARDLSAMRVDEWMFDGFGLGGAFEKDKLGQICAWLCEELPVDKPRHLLGISEPDDFFAAIESGADTFDCVSPSRVARNSAVYTPYGRVNMKAARYKRDWNPINSDCPCYTCKNFSRAYLCHLFRADEILGKVLCTIHNEYFIVNLVDSIRESINNGSYLDIKEEVLGKYYK